VVSSLEGCVNIFVRGELKTVGLTWWMEDRSIDSGLVKSRPGDLC